MILMGGETNKIDNKRHAMKEISRDLNGLPTNKDRLLVPAIIALRGNIVRNVLGLDLRDYRIFYESG